MLLRELPYRKPRPIACDKDVQAKTPVVTVEQGGRRAF
jgi:hypothetical protein